MCSGKQTEMSCGHVLTQYTQRCAKGQQTPCEEPALDAPRGYIRDSCAGCDPEFNANRISRAHKARHAELVAQLQAQRRAGRPDAVRQLLERIEKLRRTADLAIGEARTRVPASVDVEFPGGFGGGDSVAASSKWTSRWVDGKCVWEEEPAWTPGMGRIKKVYESPKPPTPEEEAAAQPAVTGPPRMRTLKKGYTYPSSLTPPQEKPPITGPPRLRQDKPYSGPRENYVVVEQETPQRQRSLRRKKGYVYEHGLSASDVTNRRSENTAKDTGKEQIRPVAPGVEEKEEEDIWMQLAEKTINDKGKSFSQRMKERIAMESRLAAQQKST
ncbi:hypothetical protein F5Y05DRAFT_422391 [Hypoxylon sp. FL0543]|nr:hypothetical protein F5Y05DRAFT_422391 [Hypoxylon sp. FL0543]